MIKAGEEFEEPICLMDYMKHSSWQAPANEIRSASGEEDMLPKPEPHLVFEELDKSFSSESKLSYKKSSSFYH